MPDEVRRKDGKPVALAVVEGLGIERIVPGNLRPERHRRREPMLPANGVVEVRGFKPGALTVLVVEILNAPGNVVHGRELVVQISKRGPLPGGALDLAWIALREERRVAHGREWRAR